MAEENQISNEREEKKPFDKRFLIFGLVLIIIIAVVAWLLVRSTGSSDTGQVEGVKEENPQEQEKPKTVGEDVYFSEDAKIMYFYSDSCGWCVQQKEVLAELGYEGYRFKPMDVGQNQSLWKQYEISGTPTFIAANGDQLVGYREKAELKVWIDKHLK